MKKKELEKLVESAVQKKLIKEDLVDKIVGYFGNKIKNKNIDKIIDETDPELIKAIDDLNKQYKETEQLIIKNMKKSLNKKKVFNKDTGEFDDV